MVRDNRKWERGRSEIVTGYSSMRRGRDAREDREKEGGKEEERERAKTAPAQPSLGGLGLLHRCLSVLRPHPHPVLDTIQYIDPHTRTHTYIYTVAQPTAKSLTGHTVIHHSDYGR